MTTGFGMGQGQMGYGMGPASCPSCGTQMGYPLTGTFPFQGGTMPWTGTPQFQGGMMPWQGMPQFQGGMMPPWMGFQGGMMPWTGYQGFFPGYQYGQGYPWFTPGYGQGYQTMTIPDDEQIREMIFDAIDADPLVPYDSDIEVEVTGGLVTLTGTVPNKRIKHSVGDDAWWIPGVWDVNNQLQVAGRARTTERTRETRETTRPTPTRTRPRRTGTQG